jgi:hypothetical protein
MGNMRSSTPRIAMSNRMHQIVRGVLTLFIAVCAFSLFASIQARAAKEFQSAIKMLDSDEKRSAERIIGFLGTEESTRYIVQHLENQYIFMLGLTGSPIWPVVVSEMEKGLESPDRAVSIWHLYTLSNCAYALNHSTGMLYPNGQDKDKIQPLQGKQESNEEALKKRTGHNALLKFYAKKLAAEIPNKKGSSKSASILTLLNVTDDWQNEIRSSLPAELLEKISSDVIQLFFDF